MPSPRGCYNTTAKTGMLKWGQKVGVVGAHKLQAMIWGAWDPRGFRSQEWRLKGSPLQLMTVKMSQEIVHSEVDTAKGVTRQEDLNMIRDELRAYNKEHQARVLSE